MLYVVSASSSIEPIITLSNLQTSATNTPSITAQNGISGDQKFNDDTIVTRTIHPLEGTI